MSQRELLEVHMNTIPDPVEGTPAARTLSELAYTASETGILDGVDSQSLIAAWKLVTMAISMGGELPEGFRM